MHAVIVTGGKQYLVKEGDTVRVEKLLAKEGEKVVFDKVLLAFDGKEGEVKLGQPELKDVKVEAMVLEQGKAKKIVVIKFKPKVRYHRKYGHRQRFTKVKIEKITV